MILYKFILSYLANSVQKCNYMGLILFDNKKNRTLVHNYSIFIRFRTTKT